MADFATHGHLSGSAPRPRPSQEGDVIANFFPDTLQLLMDFASGEKLTTPLELYDFQPTRQYLLKLSVPGGHGRELEATQSLPTMTPVTLAFQPYFTKLFWARESTEYLILTEILQQQKVVALNRQFPRIIPWDVVIQAGVTLAYAAKTWQVKDLGAYNLAVLEPFELGYKLGVLDLADWTS